MRDPNFTVFGLLRPSRCLRPGPRGPRVKYDETVREAARALFETTPWSYNMIGATVGVGPSAVWTWARAGGWVRYPEAPPPGRSGPRGPCRRGVGAEKRRKAAERLQREAERERPRPPRSLRSAGQPYRADTVGAVRRLWEGSTLSLDAIAERVGVSKATVWRWVRRPGWVRFADAVVADDRRWRPYPEAVRAEARRLVEQSLLSTALIAARVKVHPSTLHLWRKRGGWNWARREEIAFRRRERRRGERPWVPYRLGP